MSESPEQLTYRGGEDGGSGDQYDDGVEMTKSLVSGDALAVTPSTDDHTDGETMDGGSADASGAAATGGREGLRRSSRKARHGDFGPAGTATKRQVAVNIFISFVGAGMLGMPYAFKQSGWFLGALGLFSVSAANVYSMLLLVKCRKKLEAVNQTEVAGYGDVGKLVLGDWGEKFVNILLVISQTGFATAYIIFISANFYSIANVNPIVTCFGCVPILSLLVQVRDMKHLSNFSLIADVAMMFGLTAVLFQDVKYYKLEATTVSAAHWHSVLYIASVTLYSMEGIGLILPLEASSEDRPGFPKLLMQVVAFITTLMAVFGIGGYMGFGEETQTPITLNLSGTWANFVKMALCLALYLTYPVMMFPVNQVIEDIFLQRPTAPGGEKHPISRKVSLVFRSSVVFCTASVAYSIPNFGEFLALVGSSICVLLGFLLPCYFHLRVFDWKTELQTWEIGFDIFLICFGTVFAVTGTFNSLKNLLADDDVQESP